MEVAQVCSSLKKTDIYLYATFLFLKKGTMCKELEVDGIMTWICW